MSGQSFKRKGSRVYVKEIIVTSGTNKKGKMSYNLGSYNVINIVTRT